MAYGQLPRSLSPCLHADPGHARRPRLRLAMGYADEGNRADGLDDRAQVRNRMREAWAEQAPLETHHRSFRKAERQRPATQPVLEPDLRTNASDVCRNRKSVPIFPDHAGPDPSTGAVNFHFRAKKDELREFGRVPGCAVDMP